MYALYRSYLDCGTLYMQKSCILSNEKMWNQITFQRTKSSGTRLEHWSLGFSALFNLPGPLQTSEPGSGHGSKFPFLIKLFDKVRTLIKRAHSAYSVSDHAKITHVFKPFKVDNISVKWNSFADGAVFSIYIYHQVGSRFTNSTGIKVFMCMVQSFHVLIDVSATWNGTRKS